MKPKRHSTKVAISAIAGLVVVVAGSDLAGVDAWLPRGTCELNPQFFIP